MTGVEILLLVTGVVFFIASFFITEKLGPGELNKIGELSNEEIQRIMERELQKVTDEIEGRVEEKAEEALVNSERMMEKECNEKIMAISEYSDTVVESMNKTHNEIMFLYSMLNDKHAELTDFSAKLNELAKELEKKDEAIVGHLSYSAPFEEKKEPAGAGKDEPAAFRTEIKEENFLPEEDADDSEESNHNADILALHKQGKSAIDIARELALGLGEVQLVIGLYEGKRKK
ncbi:hypothetical protein IMSAGC012_03324 [Lachnospiraceae bacterium]|jgi:uncharacterized coiled-coil DUF342 family protein|nr:hypothetical protein [Eubacterium sp.]GFI28193.1 hypothetical protein IMSAGC012_03324 [Lachnospiraceae bacterium]